MPETTARMANSKLQRKTGLWVTYGLSMMVLAFGISCAVWLAVQTQFAWAWFVTISATILLETSLNWQESSNSLMEAIFSVLLCGLWVVPILIWFESASADSQLLIIVFLFATALSGILLKPAGYTQVFLSSGIALPVAFVLLWQPGRPTSIYSSSAVLGGWICLLGLGVLLVWSSKQRLKFMDERRLLLKRLEIQIKELNRAREEEKKARALADQANKDKSRFLAMVSHDLRQPVYAANLMIENARTTENASLNGETLDKIRSSFIDLTEHFEALLDTAMLETGTMLVNAQWVSLPELSLQITNEFRDMALERSINLVVDLPSVLAFSDPVLLGRILRNLVSNAMYHSSGNQIRIGFSGSADLASIVVEDDGQGLPETVLVDFNQKVPIQNPDTQGQTGERRGLGLSIVHRLSDLLKLSVQVKSSNSGTAFEIGPIKVKPFDEFSKATSDISARVNGETIVLIEDDESILERLTNVLTRWGYNVHASTGTLPDIAKADLLIADLDLDSDCDGVDLVGQARQRWGKTLPAFIITGNKSNDSAQKIETAGLRVMYKPIQPAALKSIILTELACNVTEC